MFRASDAYDLLPFQGGARVVPRTTGTNKLLSAPAARILQIVSRPDQGGQLDRAGRQLALALALDGVFEVEQDGRWLMGPALLPALGLAVPAHSRDTLGGLSIRALQHVASIHADPSGLAARLYSFHRRPLPCTAEAFARRDEDSLAVLGLGVGTLARRSIAKHWVQELGDSPWFKSWHAWTRGGAQHSPQHTVHKLYLGMRWEWLQEHVRDLMELLAECGALQVKVARRRGELLRPDHTVAYFGERAQLMEAAARLAPHCAPGDAHGVPFTCPLTGDGALSHGVDPPHATWAAGGGAARDSWRRWVVSCAASALDTARRHPAPSVTPWEFALVRLELQGVDVSTWLSAGEP